MIKNPRDKEYLPTKQEAYNNASDQKASATSSGLWSGGLKNPRIVRVSRAFGGKDRHSKVSTIRGLRDRRVRLSVPTAIQLYDLQDRLGVNQPSKVVDWLLNAAREEIDKLPPLGNFIQIPQSLIIPAQSHDDEKSNINELGLTAFPQSAYWPQRSEPNVNKPVQYSPYYHWEEAPSSNANYLSNQPEGTHVSTLVPGVVPSMFPSYVQMQMALQTPQSNDTSDHPLQLGGPSVIRHFQS